MSDKPNIQAPSPPKHEQSPDVSAYLAKAGTGGYDKQRGQIIRVSGPVPVLAISSELEGPAYPASRITATLGFTGTETETISGPVAERVGLGGFLSSFDLLDKAPSTWYDANRVPQPSWEKEANGPLAGHRFKISQHGFGLLCSVFLNVQLSTTVAPAQLQFRLVRDSDAVVLAQTPEFDVSNVNSPRLLHWSFHNVGLSHNVFYYWELARLDGGSSNITFKQLSFHFDGVV